jgi:hypothetical protein
MPWRIVLSPEAGDDIELAMLYSATRKYPAVGTTRPSSGISRNRINVGIILICPKAGSFEIHFSIRRRRENLTVKIPKAFVAATCCCVVAD